MTDLTEQYINGNLQDGNEYYIENKDGEVSTMHLYNDTIHWHSFKVKKLKVLVPVPSYDEYQKLLSDQLAKNEGEEINAELERRLAMVKANGKYPDRISRLKSRVGALSEENAKLKELLKRVVNATDFYHGIKTASVVDYGVWYNIANEINQVLGEE